ncbi:IS110 family transposase [Pseudomonas cichorii]|uniref:IS110 family transposase n=2 Tax=Pseudomonas cichorii TaxID=36746 RepID=UPI001C89F5CD|nr:IS110 family transposase [Pseudomonas cichorii]MBX8497005.1 IS110 family transposase [Pseudomonas cichorii]
MSAHAGIDVSKATLQVALFPKADDLCVPNTEEGLASIAEYLSAHQVERVLVEATGGYEKLSVKLLANAGFKVQRINPVRSRQFALAMGKRAKTDPIDAQMLAMFASSLEEKGFAKPDEEREVLLELVNLRSNLLQQRDDNRRRIKQAVLPCVVEVYLALEASLKVQIKSVDQLVAAQARRVDSELLQRLQAVKGVGPVTIASLFCYLPELGDLSRGQIAALAGVAPYNNDSGTKAGKRQIYGGRTKLRRAAYMCALVMVCHNVDFKARYARLRAKGKCAKVALVACMRVLLIRLNAMVRDGTPWRDHAV